MCFFRKMFNTEPFDYTLGSFTFSHTNNIHMFILLEHTINSHFFFKQTSSKIYFLWNISTINLYFHDMVLLLPQIQLAHLSSGNSSNYSSIFLQSIDFNFNRFLLFIIMFLSIFRECLFLAVHPVLVESS